MRNLIRDINSPCIAVVLTSLVIVCVETAAPEHWSPVYLVTAAVAIAMAALNWIGVFASLIKDGRLLPSLFLLSAMANAICFLLAVLTSLCSYQLPEVFPAVIWLAITLICKSMYKTLKENTVPFAPGGKPGDKD